MKIILRALAVVYACLDFLSAFSNSIKICKTYLAIVVLFGGGLLSFSASADNKYGIFPARLTGGVWKYYQVEYSGGAVGYHPNYIFASIQEYSIAACGVFAQNAESDPNISNVYWDPPPSSRCRFKWKSLNESFQPHWDGASCADPLYVQIDGTCSDTPPQPPPVAPIPPEKNLGGCSEGPSPYVSNIK